GLNGRAKNPIGESAHDALDLALDAQLFPLRAQALPAPPNPWGGLEGGDAPSEFPSGLGSLGSRRGFAGGRRSGEGRADRGRRSLPRPRTSERSEAGGPPAAFPRKGRPPPWDPPHSPRRAAPKALRGAAQALP